MNPADSSSMPGLFDQPLAVESPDEAYRPLCRWAVAALILGLLAPVALFGPALWCVPVAGAVAAAAALGSMARPDVAMVGRGAALAGLVLSCGCAAAGVTCWLGSWRLAERHAVAAAEAWVGLVRDGRLLDARGMFDPLSAPAGLLTVAGADDDLARPINDAASLEAGMGSLPAVVAIAGCAGAAAPAGSFQAFVPDSQEQKEDWQVRVRLGPCGGKDPVTLLVHLRRSMLPDAATWSGWAENWAITAVE